MSSLRLQFPRSLRQGLARRTFISTSPARTTAGYGDPQSEKIENDTPLPSSSTDPKPKGQGSGPGTKTGTTDPEVKKGKTGNAGGKKGSDSGDKPNAQEIRETKKIGEDPKNEEVGGAGPKGG